MSTPRPGLQRFRDAGSANTAVQVEAARIAARRGNREEAGQFLRSAVKTDPRCTEAWLGLAWLAESSEERRRYLRQVLALDPGNVRARAEMVRLGQSAPSHEAAATAAGQSAPPAPKPAPLSPMPVKGISQRPGSSRRAVTRDGRRLKGGRRRVLRWLLIPGAIALVLAVALLALEPLIPGLALWVSPPAPASSPSPTLSPAQVAGRFAPQLESALLRADWDRAMELVTIMRSLAPNDPGVAGWTRDAHVQMGQALVMDGLAVDAETHFDAALEAVPGDQEALLWQSATEAYLTGRQALLAADWEAAVSAFELVQAQIPGYSDGTARLLEAYRGLGQASSAAANWGRAIEAFTKILEMDPGALGVGDSLVVAYRERGIAYEAAGKLKEARADLEAALVLAPGDAAAKAHLEKVMDKLFPPKRIEIDISEQRMYVYLGDKLLHKWVISTGLPGRDTATGHYKVLDKIPMAYSKVWNLKMPYWLGIYYVGSIENGIHALPIRPDGSVMWAGLLGQKASYGCIILDNKAAPVLFDWAEIGTKVDIHY
ncbi:MAG TPA: tetratricopeptide repeat protein [Anaerolineae bacterium]|nr:tetratricopeptide repeat protein [Anaerolineae bacterium]